MPFAGYALELMQTAVVESNAGADDQVLHRPRYQDFVGSGLGRHSGANVHGDAADRAVDLLTLTGVQARANLDSDLADGFNDG